MDKFVPRLRSPITVAGELHLTEHGNSLARQLLSEYERRHTPDALQVLYIARNGVQYGGTLYRITTT